MAKASSGGRRRSPCQIVPRLGAEIGTDVDKRPARPTSPTHDHRHPTPGRRPATSSVTWPGNRPASCCRQGRAGGDGRTGKAARQNLGAARLKPWPMAELTANPMLDDQGVAAGSSEAGPDSTTDSDVEDPAAPGELRGPKSPHAGPTADALLVERWRYVLGLYCPPTTGTPFQRAWPYVCFAVALWAVSHPPSWTCPLCASVLAAPVAIT